MESIVTNLQLKMCLHLKMSVHQNLIFGPILHRWVQKIWSFCENTRFERQRVHSFPLIAIVLNCGGSRALNGGGHKFMAPNYNIVNTVLITTIIILVKITLANTIFLQMRASAWMLITFCNELPLWCFYFSTVSCCERTGEIAGNNITTIRNICIISIIRKNKHKK